MKLLRDLRQSETVSYVKEDQSMNFVFKLERRHDKNLVGRLLDAKIFYTTEPTMFSFQERFVIH